MSWKGLAGGEVAGMLLGPPAGRWRGDKVTGIPLWRQVVLWLRDEPAAAIWDAAFPGRTAEQMVIWEGGSHKEGGPGLV